MPNAPTDGSITSATAVWWGLSTSHKVSGCAEDYGCDYLGVRAAAAIVLHRLLGAGG